MNVKSFVFFTKVISLIIGCPVGHTVKVYDKGETPFIKNYYLPRNKNLSELILFGTFFF